MAAIERQEVCLVRYIGDHPPHETFDSMGLIPQMIKPSSRFVGFSVHLGQIDIENVHLL
jgi:hypothetical protein